MSKLINELYPIDEAELLEDEIECEYEISFQPMADERTGKIVAVLMVKTCLECGTETVEEIFTDGSLDAELLARDMGYRNEYDEDEEYYS